LSEGQRYFQGKAEVQFSLDKLCRKLEEEAIPYAIVGGMALFLHGFQRFTDDVDILVTRPNLERIHEALEGRGYLRPFERSKNLRDTEHGVRIEFLITGEYPGDGRPKPVSFPDPQEKHVMLDGQRVITLAGLIELKLASGITNAARLKDLADVQELIKTLSLPLETVNELNPFVQSEFVRLWNAIHNDPMNESDSAFDKQPS
jgi:hypothetical protein